MQKSLIVDYLEVYYNSPKCICQYTKDVFVSFTNFGRIFLCFMTNC